MENREKALGIAHGLFMIYLGVQARGIPQAAKLASIGFGILAVFRALKSG